MQQLSLNCMNIKSLLINQHSCRDDYTTRQVLLFNMHGCFQASQRALNATLYILIMLVLHAFLF